MSSIQALAGDDKKSLLLTRCIRAEKEAKKALDKRQELWYHIYSKGHTDDGCFHNAVKDNRLMSKSGGYLFLLLFALFEESCKRD